jgi:RND family efflux transporter MFP subunit
VVPFPRLHAYADAHDAAHAHVPEAPSGVAFLKEQQWKIQAKTQPAVGRKLVEPLRLAAVVQAKPGGLAEVTPPVSGRLLLATSRSMPLVGDTVEVGQVLAMIRPSFSEAGARFVEAEGEVVRTRLALQQAELAFERTRELATVNAKSGRELQEAEFALKTAQAKHNAALALQATYQEAGKSQTDRQGSDQPAIELRSPITGTIIAQSGAAVGQYINPEEALFTVLDATSVFIEAHVPEASINRLGATEAASYEVPGQTGQIIPITDDANGRLVFVGINVNPTTRTVPLVYEAKNTDARLRVGQLLDLYVETSRVEETLAIPSIAVVEEDGRPIAFVQVSGETFEKRDLTLGIRDRNWLQVISGITEGERVVTEGAYAVRLASVSSNIPAHGHVH